MKRIYQQVALYLFLMPVFFVFHGYYENFGFIGITDCLLLMVTYCGAAAFFYFIFYAIYKDHIRAAMLASFVMGYYFFFGALHDFLKEYTPGLHKYSVLLPLFVIILVVLLIVFKKIRKPFFRTTVFLNVLFTVYLVVDAWGIGVKAFSPAKDKLATYDFAKLNQTKTCDTCRKPDIYFLLFDEYASSVSLQQQYGYDNSRLDSFLTQAGFHLQLHSRSNYNFTPFSMSSILNMSYLEGIHNIREISADDYANCNILIRDNEVIRQLSAEGYDIFNYSVFDLAGNPSQVEQSFLPLKTKLITDRTLFAYVRRDIAWMLYTGRFKLNWLTEGTTYRHYHNNEKFANEVIGISRIRQNKPRFVYAHFYMPHPPFFIAKDGKLKDEATVFKEFKEIPVQAYLDYLPYVNNKIEEIVSAIQKNSGDSAVIILMGDHGFRRKTDAIEPSFYFQNQHAVFFPDGDYHLLYDSISGVNTFRVVFNKLFNRNIALAKDTSYFLHDKK